MFSKIYLLHICHIELTSPEMQRYSLLVALCMHKSLVEFLTFMYQFICLQIVSS